MAEIKWIKISTDMFDDEAIELIETMPEGDSIIVIWLKLLLKTGKINDNGFLYFKKEIPYTEEMLATIFGKPLNIIRLALKTFEQFGMISITDEKGIFITNWEKHQNVSAMEQVREYNKMAKRKQRQKQKEMLALKDMSMTSQRQVKESHETDIDKNKNKNKNKNNITSINSVSVNKNFIPPTHKDIEDYLNISGKKISDKSIQDFINYWSADNWCDKNGLPIRSWKQKALSWANRDEKYQTVQKFKTKEELEIEQANKTRKALEIWAKQED